MTELVIRLILVKDNFDGAPIEGNKAPNKEQTIIIQVWINLKSYLVTDIITYFLLVTILPINTRKKARILNAYFQKQADPCEEISTMQSSSFFLFGLVPNKANRSSLFGRLAQHNLLKPIFHYFVLYWT